MSQGHRGHGNCKHKTPAENAAQRARTARNKVKAIQKALLTAGGNCTAFLRERLRYWQTGAKA